MVPLLAPSLLPLVGMWFQALFHSPPRGAFHLSLTVLVRYRSHGSILALGGGPPSFTPDFSGRALLRNTATTRPSSSPTGLSPSLAPRSRGLQLTSRAASAGPSTPVRHAHRFRLSARSARRYSGPRILLPLPPGTEMFQFPGFASLQRVMTAIPDGRVAPFGHPGITGCVPLPPAYRSLPRPSSPPCAQASPTCPP